MIINHLDVYVGFANNDDKKINNSANLFRDYQSLFSRNKSFFVDPEILNKKIWNRTVDVKNGRTLSA